MKTTKLISAIIAAIQLTLFSGCSSKSETPSANSETTSSNTTAQAQESDITDNIAKSNPEFMSHTLSGEELSLYKNSFRQAYCFDGTVVALAADGNVITWGNTYYGKTGNGEIGNYISDTPSEPSDPYLIDFTQDIASVGSSKLMAYAITNSGEVYMWGYNGFGQTGTEVGSITEPQKIELSEKITKVASEDAVTLFLTDNGEVYFSGVDISQYSDIETRNLNIAFEYDASVSDEQYALTIAEPGYTKMELPFKCKDISVGIMNYAFLSQTGEVYIKGTLVGDYDMKAANITHDELYKVKFPEKISAVESGSNFIMALSESGKVYLYGTKESVFFDESSDIEISENIFRKGGLDNIVSISCNMYCACAVDDSGIAWGFGIDNEGSIDESIKNETEKDYEIFSIPHRYEYEGVQECISEISNSTLIMNNGSLVILGSDNCGQISKCVSAS